MKEIPADTGERLVERQNVNADAKPACVARRVLERELARSCERWRDSARFGGKAPQWHERRTSRASDLVAQAVEHGARCYSNRSAAR